MNESRKVVLINRNRVRKRNAAAMVSMATQLQTAHLRAASVTSVVKRPHCIVTAKLRHAKVVHLSHCIETDLPPSAHTKDVVFRVGN